MKIGVPKEIKNNEFRVSLTPASVKITKSNGIFSKTVQFAKYCDIVLVDRPSVI